MAYAKRRRLTAAQRRNGPAYGSERRNFGLPGATPTLNAPFAAALAPMVPPPPPVCDCDGGQGSLRHHYSCPAFVLGDGPRIRTANFDAILANEPQGVVARRVIGKGWRNERQ